MVLPYVYTQSIFAGGIFSNMFVSWQVCHDARESLQGQPQISCPQTIAQVSVRVCVLPLAVFFEQRNPYTKFTNAAPFLGEGRGKRYNIPTHV